jgi:hypothetical protein
MSMVTKATYNLVTFKDLMKTVTLTSYKQQHTKPALDPTTSNDNLDDDQITKAGRQTIF